MFIFTLIFNDCFRIIKIKSHYLSFLFPFSRVFKYFLKRDDFFELRFLKILE